MSKVTAVIVTYFPQIAVLQNLLNSLKSQVHHVVVVDNSPSNAKSNAPVQGSPDSQILTIRLGKNLGIAAAQNIGIDWAKSQNSDFVVLFDQDSQPANDMVAKLLDAHQQMSDEGQKVAAFGPRYLDERQNNPPPFIRIRGLTLERCACATEDSVVPVDYLISSGCLIPMSVLDKVGGMRDDLFIDYVDIEWGLRARHHGFQSYGVCSAHMQHSLGDHPIKFFGRNIPLHSPLRHYYHFRNAVLLYKEPWVPLNWKLVDGWRLCLKYVFYSLFAKPRMAHWRMMTLGVWHGLVGNAGKLDGSAS